MRTTEGHDEKREERKERVRNSLLPGVQRKGRPATSPSITVIGVGKKEKFTAKPPHSGEVRRVEKRRNSSLQGTSGGNVWTVEVADEMERKQKEKKKNRSKTPTYLPLQVAGEKEKGPASNVRHFFRTSRPSSIELVRKRKKKFTGKKKKSCALRDQRNRHGDRQQKEKKGGGSPLLIQERLAGSGRTKGGRAHDNVALDLKGGRARWGKEKRETKRHGTRYADQRQDRREKRKI